MGRFDHLATRPARSVVHLARWKLAGRARSPVRPEARTPWMPNDATALDADVPSLTWIGHATFVIKLGGTVVATDPNWNDRVAIRRRQVAPGLDLAAAALRVRVIVVSHNHRDHMDRWTLERLASDKVVVVPTGNAKSLRGLGARRIVELDWWQTHREGDLAITLVPARHWSMRTPFDRNDSLWGGFVLRGPEGAAYHSGDTGMFDGFDEIGARAGPIDWAMLPIGAYAPRWFMAPQHICPEEAGEAFERLRARHLVAMHWGTFRLTDEPLDEPPERLRAWAAARGHGDDRIWILAAGETRLLRA